MQISYLFKKGVNRLAAILTPIKSIRAKCKDCTNNQYLEIKECTLKNCPLWPYRMGKRPKKNIENT